MSRKPDLSRPEQQQLVQQHSPLVGRIARSVAQGMPPNVLTDDLVQDGMLGLIDAIIRTTRETSGAEFEHYLARRARGAMLDGLRALDPATRLVRRRMREVEQALQRLGHRLGRAPVEGEVAQDIDMPLEDYRQLLQQAHGYWLVSLDDLTENADLRGYLDQCAGSDADPLVMLERSVFRKALANSLATLNGQMQEVLSLYYAEGYKMHEIGTHMGLSESRVSQLHTSAIAGLRAQLLDAEQRQQLLRPRRAQR
ncbi:MAG: hypothetical protein A3E00_12750 [Curvibacter sp. RIFCSPHIGHO2_12_FULL_63_18]|uniref:FliA/WhiG family RNA polymerase sigma factor n=1 Tax=Rhodoferax sp. TaxID=50421 RepID=UPI0008AAB7B6|nr:FliA/WhiG family RNA polymerase sigma factor [Rhodoferax sp.]OGO96926.1 MAG: hypothetical protein A2037_10945 [Curvibacter sp. GWA2_63_95]OGP01103.1 MAG: hypothetical protein A3E00_12750 [Curvibacter sp. RIFCSPHIGHO2_12_FULL_63_18]HCX80689.1 RNA polymerase sigma factor FliA [Rhodoferax sp.]